MGLVVEEESLKGPLGSFLIEIAQYPPKPLAINPCKAFLLRFRVSGLGFRVWGLAWASSYQQLYVLNEVCSGRGPSDLVHCRALEDAFSEVYLEIP